MTQSPPRKSRSPKPGQTISVQICLPIELSNEIGKIRVVERTNNATVIADLLRAGLAARGIAVACSPPAVVTGRPVTSPSTPVPKPKAKALSMAEQLARLPKPKSLAQQQAEAASAAAASQKAATDAAPSDEEIVVNPFDLTDDDEKPVVDPFKLVT